MVFPLAMYTTGMLRLSEALGLPFLVAIAQVTVWAALAAWLVAATGMLRRLLHHYRMPEKLADARIDLTSAGRGAQLVPCAVMRAA